MIGKFEKENVDNMDKMETTDKVDKNEKNGVIQKIKNFFGEFGNKKMEKDIQEQKYENKNSMEDKRKAFIDSLKVDSSESNYNKDSVSNKKNNHGEIHSDSGFIHSRAGDGFSREDGR